MNQNPRWLVTYTGMSGGSKVYYRFQYIYLYTAIKKVVSAYLNSSNSGFKITRL